MSATIAATGAQPQAIASGLKRILALAMLVLLAACAAIPRGGEGPPPVVSPDPLDGMHRVALLLPLTGPDGDVGLSLANATALALTRYQIDQYPAHDLRHQFGRHGCDQSRCRGREQGNPWPLARRSGVGSCKYRASQEHPDPQLFQRYWRCWTQCLPAWSSAEPVNRPCGPLCADEGLLTVRRTRPQKHLWTARLCDPDTIRAGRGRHFGGCRRS